MPEKLGNGGNGLEDYSAQTGRYISDGEPNVYYDNPSERAGKLFGFNGPKIKSIDYISKTTSEGKERNIYNPLAHSKEERENFYHALDEQDRKIYGDEFVNQVLEKSKKPTAKINTPERKQMRQQWVSSEIQRQSSERKIQYGHHAVLVLGVPASGKSTISNSVIANNGAYEIDSDIFKEDYIPEFINDKTMTCATQKEAGDLSKDMMKQVTAKGANVCIGKVGGSYTSIEKVIDNLKELDYTIDVIYNDLPTELAQQRAQNRFKLNQRYVPSFIFYQNGYNILKVMDRCARNDKVNGIMMYDNDVMPGEKPKLLFKAKTPKEIL